MTEAVARPTHAMEPARGGEALIYDVLISYSAERDAELSGALRRALVRLGKPLWKLRAVRVYRDVESGVGSPDLRKGLRRALCSSRFLILLARPEAARSDYVRWELDQWIQGVHQRGDEPSDFLLIVQTAGRIATRSPTGELDWNSTDALPDRLDHPWREAGEPVRELSSVLGTTMRLEDLVWAGSSEARQRRAKDFQSVVASLASSIRGIPKDDILSEEIRRRRQTIRILSLTALVLLGLVLIAGSQWRRAERERMAADVATWVERGARARLLAADARTQAEALQVGVDAVAPALEVGMKPPPRAIGGLHAALRSLRQTYVVEPALGPVVAGHLVDDGRTLVVGCRGGALVRLDPEHGRVLAMAEGRPSAGDYLCLATTPDGRWLTTARMEDGCVERWDARELTRVGRWEVEGDELWTSAAGDPRRTRIAVGSDAGRLHVLALEEFGVLSSYAALAVPAVGLAWSPDGETLAARGLDGSLRLVDLAVPDFSVSEMASPRGAAGCVAWLPDGRLVVASEEVVFLLDRATGRWAELGRAAQKVTRLRSSPDGQWLAAFGFQREATLWRLDERSPQAPVTLVHGQDVEQVAFSPSGPLVLTGTADGWVHAWDRRSGQHVTGFPAHSDSVQWLAFEPSARRYFSAGFEGSVRFSDLAPRDDYAPLTRHEARASGVARIGGAWVTCGWDGRVLRHTGSKAETIGEQSDGIAFLPTSTDLSLVAALGFSGEVQVFDSDGALLWSAAAHSGKVLAATFADPRVLFTGGEDGAVRRFDARDGRSLGEALRDLDTIRSMASVPTAGAVVAGGAAGLLYVMDARTGAELARLRSPGGPIADLAARPGRPQVLTCGGGSVALWDIGGRRMVRELAVEGAYALDLEFDPVGVHLAVARSDGFVEIREIDSGLVVAMLAGGGRDIEHLMYSSDGTCFAAASEQGAIALYRTEGWEPLQLLQTGSAARVCAVGFSEDGQELCACDEDGLVAVFGLSASALLEQARAWLREK